MITWPATIIFVALLAAVTFLGFWAARWQPGDLGRLSEWGIGGRRFGSIISWFLIGGDMYTSYTFIAVPALLFATGAAGFFAVPYTTIAFPIMYLILPRFWTLARHRGYVTSADFVLERFESRALSLCIAATGILATMPYIALQMYGIEVVLQALGVPVELALVLAFALLAAYTYTSGLRAPALLALVKDFAIWIVVLVALVVFSFQLGGIGHVFSAVPRAKLLLSPSQYGAYATLALGSACALFLYPHMQTAILACNSRRAIRRNASWLPAYTFMLGLIALLGYVALAVGIHPSATYGANSSIPDLFAAHMPAWFAGFAFAALAIGALVPASVMSIAAANLFTRNVYREFLRPSCSEEEETTVAKSASLIVKLGALVFIMLLPSGFAINLQLLGGIWMLQTLPTVVVGMYTRWLHRRALLFGWSTGMLVGTLMAVSEHFHSSIYTLSFAGFTIPLYAAVAALLVNLALCYGLTPLFRLGRIPEGEDATSPSDYEAHPLGEEDVAGKEEVSMALIPASPLGLPSGGVRSLQNHDHDPWADSAMPTQAQEP